MKLNKIFNKETGLYILFGVLTTLVNYVSFWLCYKTFCKETPLTANVISFVLATLFAYFTNKVYVFENRSWKTKIVVKEIISFFGARVSTFLVIEQLGLYICLKYFSVNKIEILHIDGTMIAKIVLSFIAVIANYLVSKLVVFKKHEE